MREGKHEHWFEIVFLLDAMLPQGAINIQLNNMLAEPLGEEEGEEEIDVEDEDKFTKRFPCWLDYVIEYAKNELTDLLTEHNEESTEGYIDTLLELGELTSALLNDEFLEGNPIFPMIGEMRRRLQSSPIRKSKRYILKIYYLYFYAM